MAESSSDLPVCVAELGGGKHFAGGFRRPSGTEFGSYAGPVPTRRDLDAGRREGGGAGEEAGGTG